MAQLASLLLMPLLSRLYSPEEFGTFAVYYALSTVFGLISTLRFDVTIVLAKDENEAAHLVWLSLTICALMTVLTGIAMALGAWWDLSAYLSFRLIPATLTSVLAYGIIQTLINWHSRQQSFEVLGFRNVAERVLTLGSGIGFALIGWHELGLVLAQTLGLGLSVLYLFSKTKLRYSDNDHSTWRQLVKRYADFPSRQLFSTLLSTGAGQLLSLLFAHFFSRADLGQYSLATRVLEAPINLIANTFSTVYYQTVASRSLAERQRLFLRSLKGLGLAFAGPILLLALTGPWLFSWIFGANWVIAGMLAQVLSVLTLFRLLFISQSSVLLIQRRLTIDLWISAFMFAAQVGGFALGLVYFGTMQGCVLLITILSSLVYSFSLYKIYAILNVTQSTTPMAHSL